MALICIPTHSLSKLYSFWALKKQYDEVREYSSTFVLTGYMPEWQSHDIHFYISDLKQSCKVKCGWTL